MLPKLIQRYDKKSFHFGSSSKTRDKIKLYRLSDATFYDRFNTTYQFIKKPFLDKKKCLFLRNMQPLSLLIVTGLSLSNERALSKHK